MQVSPSPPLAHIVKHFLVLENDQIANAGLRIFSDGNTGMVFHSGDPLMLTDLQDATSGMLPPSFIYGQLDRFQNIFSVGKIRMLIVVFHPFGISSLLKIPAVELKNKILDLDIFYPSESRIMADQIFHAADVFSKIRIVENFLIKLLNPNNSQNPLAFRTVRLIHQHNGNLTVHQLTAALQISERKLQRTFEEHIGLSPKRYAGVTRVHYFLKLLRRYPDRFQTSLVYDAGFFDQAHLIREMKNIAGITPGQYAGQANLLTANFLHIPQK